MCILTHLSPCLYTKPNVIKNKKIKWNKIYKLKPFTMTIGKYLVECL